MFFTPKFGHALVCFFMSHKRKHSGYSIIPLFVIVNLITSLCKAITENKTSIILVCKRENCSLSRSKWMERFIMIYSKILNVAHLFFRSVKQKDNGMNHPCKCFIAPICFSISQRALSLASIFLRHGGVRSWYEYVDNLTLKCMGFIHFFLFRIK